MFVGHYAAAIALKGKEQRANLGLLFIAVQFVDILFFPLVVAGIEKMRLVPGFTAVNSFDLYYMPFTHSLLGSVAWAALFFWLFYALGKGQLRGRAVAWAMALAVLSHWFTDLLVHTPDLPLLGDNSVKLGFGLWHNAALTFGLEAVLVAAALFYYLHRTTATTRVGKYGMLLFVLFMLVINYLNMFVLPQSEDVVELTISALVIYFLFAGIAFYLDKKRA